MDSPITADYKVVKAFLDKGIDNPATTSEFATFWKTSSKEEREQFTAQAATLMA